MQSKTTARYKTTLENILQRAARQRSAGGSRDSGINNCPDSRQADRAKRKLSVGVVSLLLLAALFSFLGLPDRAAAETVNIDISGGSLYLKGNDDGSSLQYSRNNSDWTSYTGTITVTGATTAHTITVASGSHELIMNGVQIDVLQNVAEAAFKIADNNTGNVTVILADGSNNSLKSGGNCAGLQKNGDANNSGSLTIKGAALGTGRLTATGRNGGAGIGGSKGTDVAQGDGGPGGACSNITISGGTVMAYSEDNGAGIGGGQGGSGGENDVHGTGGACSNITISGGTITAKAYIQGAGIGGGPGGGWSGGQGGACSNITISGGSVTATSAGHSAAIGGSERAAGSYITISGGSVMATGGNFSAGIGGGDNGAGSNITISGGSVTATGRNGGAGIGGGSEGDGSDITISGGQVTASGGQNGAGIGGGDDGDGSNITISGGQVTASGGQNGAGIGGGRNGAGSNITISGGSVTATGTEGGVCINSSSLYISPAQDMQIKVQAGSNANTAGPVDGSPFTAASGDMAAKVNSLVYFQSTENCVISNKDQLTAFAAYVNAGHYYVDAELAAAITLNSGVLQDDLERADDPSGFGEWTPIGSNAKPYMGTFDGKGHTISGLYVSKRQDYAGMFSCLGSGAAIKNLRLVDSAVNAASPKGATTGALVGRSEGTIENCFVNANVGGWGYLGGLAGRSYGAVSNCGANVLVWAGESGAGGLVGLLDGTLENCWVTGDVGAYNGNTGALFFQHVGGTVSNSYYVVSTVMPECSEGTAKSAAAFASGEVTWLLNGGVTDGTQVWYQDLDNGVTPYDALPQFAGFGAAVYKVRNGYSNSALAVQLTTRLDGTAADLSIILNDPSAELYLAAANDAAPWTNGIELAKKDNSTGIYQAGDNVAGGSYHIYVCVTGQDGNQVIKDSAAATLNANSTSLTLDYYAVKLPASQTGYTLAAKAGSTSPVIQGGGYTFTFKLAEGYTDSSTAVVKVNGSPVALNEDGEYTISGITAAQDVTVEGVTANTYTIAYNANGGEGTMASDTHTYDEEKALAANTFTKTGCTFSGWNTAEDGSGTNYADKAKVTNLTAINNDTINLYATWKADKPAAMFTATGADTGTLSGVTAGMQYQIGAADWSTITGTSVDLTELAACTIKVRQPGNGTTIFDSEVQEIVITKAEKPAPENGLVITQPTAGGSEGSITMPEGVEYEYSSDNGKTWISASGTVELAPGTYLIRIKAKDGSLASESIEITINKAEDPCQGQELCDLQAGTFNLYLNGIDMGEFTFAPSGSGWTIFSVAEGKYLTQLKGVLQLVDEADAAVWNYSRGCFYQTEKKTSGWWFWSHTKTTNYYLAAAADGSLTAAKSAKSAAAELYKNVSSAGHNWSDWYTIGSGQHERICLNCSCTEQGTCQFDPDTHKCQQCDVYDPAYKSMDVDVKVTSCSSGWLFWKTTYYTAQITPAAVGVTAENVEYSLDNSTWQSGTKYTSRSPVNKLYIRVTDSEGTGWNFIYADGAVSRQWE